MPFLTPTLAAAISKGVEFLLIPLLCRLVRASAYFMLSSYEENTGLPFGSTAIPVTCAASWLYSSFVNLLDEDVEFVELADLLVVAELDGLVEPVGLALALLLVLF